MSSRALRAGLDQTELAALIDKAKDSRSDYGLMWWLRPIPNANGSLGQFLVIDVERRLVAVRQRAGVTPPGVTRVVENRPYGFHEFPRLVSKLTIRNAP